MIRAEGHKQAELLRAEASRDAAVMLETSEVAVALEKMRASACAIKNTDKFFFGQEPSYLANLIMKAPETAAVLDE